MSEGPTSMRRGFSLAEFVRLTSSRPPDFLERKMEDHREFTVVMLCAMGIMGSLMWGWDYAVDPVGAVHTVVLRLLMLLLAAISVVLFVRAKSVTILKAGIFLLFFGTQIVFSMITARLEGGTVYGIAGYMFLVLAVILMCQGFSWEFSIMCALLSAAVPPVIALFGFMPGFKQLHYAILIWPAMGMACTALLAMSYNYGIRYDTQRQLERMSATDPLTAAANRRHFMPVLDQEIVRSNRYDHPLSLLIFDIDEFKTINDRFGHHVGDLVLMRLADTCRSIIRQTDTLARLGGDEFAVLLPETDLAGAFELAKTIQTAVDSTPSAGPDGEGASYSLSIGVAQARPEELTGFSLLRRADMALYEAKQSGRNCVRGSA